MNRTLLTFFQTEILKNDNFFQDLFFNNAISSLPVRFCVIKKKKKKKSFEKIIKTSYEEILSSNFSHMKQDANLQSITLEDINTNTITKHTWSDWFDTSSFIWIGLLFLFFIYMLHSGGGGSSQSSTSNAPRQSKKGIKLDNAEKKLADQIRSLEMGLKNLALKKREAEWEIRKIEMNSMSNVDIEASYEKELQWFKRQMKIEEIEVVEEKKTQELEEARDKLQDYQDENYL